MDYFKQISSLRDELHKKIIRNVITTYLPGSDYHLDLEEPLETSFTVRSRQTGRLITTQVDLTGIDGTTGELLAVTADGEEKKLYYHDLTLEQLAMLLARLESDLYTVIEKENVRHLITVS